VPVAWFSSTRRAEGNLRSLRSSAKVAGPENSWELAPVETPLLVHSPSSSMSVVAGARNHLPANWSLQFSFGIVI